MTKILSTAAGWLLLVLGGLGAAVLGLLRLVTSTHTQGILMIAASSLIPLLWIPALVACTGLALVLRGRLRWIAAAVTALSLVLIAWPMLPLRTAPEPAGRPGLTVLSINLQYGEADIEELAELIDDDVDALALQEHTPAFEAQLRDAGLLDRFPHQVGTTASDASGTMLLSRTPVELAARTETTVFENLVGTTEVDGVTWHLAVIHSAPPQAGADDWAEDAAAVQQMLEPYAEANLLAVGDFNAIPQHHTMRLILADGSLHDLAGPHTGAGWNPTWPVGRGIPTFARIDHALASRTVLGPPPRYHAISGSDHTAMLVSVMAEGASG